MPVKVLMCVLIHTIADRKPNVNLIYSLICNQLTVTRWTHVWAEYRCEWGFVFMCCCLVLALHCTWIASHRGVDGNRANLMLWRILKDSLSPFNIVIILIGFSTQPETNAFLPIVLHSPEKLERNKRGRASQSGPIVAHTVTSRVC